MCNYCSGCGLAIPESQTICSWCYGDPYYGSDGYLMDYITWTQREEDDAEECLVELQEEYDEDFG
jgi:hypothetical protein